MSHQPRLLFVVESPFSERDWQRFGIGAMSDHFDVSIVDISLIAKPALATAREGDRLRNPRILTFSDLETVKEFVIRTKPSVLLMNIGIGEIRHHIFGVARRTGALIAEFQLGAIPSASTQFRSSTDALAHRIRQLPSLSDLPRAIQVRRNNRKWSHCQPDVFFRGGLKAQGRHPSGGISIVDVHSLDYELMLDVMLNDPKTNSRRVVYLDQNLGFHSDVPGLGLRHPTKPENFYPRLNSFFEWLNQKHDLDVVICLHPRASTALATERFPNLFVSCDATVNEINQSCAVIGHYSTSLSFAVLAKIPILLITNSELARSWYSPYIKSFAHELAAPVVDLDEPRTWMCPQQSLKPAQRNAYVAYEQNFLRSYDGPVRRLWEIIGDELLQRING